MGRQIDGVVEHRTFGIRTARQGSAALTGQAAATGRRSINARAIEGCPQQARRVGEVLQQVGIDIEADHERQVLGAQDLIQKIGPDFLLHLEHLPLAAAGIDQNAQGQGEVGFGGEILDGLRVAVLVDLEVVPGQIGNQPAFLIFDIEEELDNIDINFERAHRLVPLIVLALRGRVVRVRSAGQVGKLLGQGQGHGGQTGCHHGGCQQ